MFDGNSRAAGLECRLGSDRDFQVHQNTSKSTTSPTRNQRTTNWPEGSPQSLDRQAVFRRRKSFLLSLFARYPTRIDVIVNRSAGVRGISRHDQAPNPLVLLRLGQAKLSMTLGQDVLEDTLASCSCIALVPSRGTRGNKPKPLFGYLAMKRQWL